MVKTPSSTPSSIPASSVSSMSKVGKNTQLSNKIKSKVQVQAHKSVVKVHVIPVKNEDEIIMTTLLNSYCIKEFLNSCKGQSNYINKLISHENLILAFDSCRSNHEHEISQRAEKDGLDINEITDVSDIFFPSKYGTFTFCNVVRFLTNGAARAFFEELSLFNGTVFNDKPIEIVYHVPQFTTVANNFFVNAVLCYLCPTPDNNEDNNDLQIMQTGYHGYF